MTLSQKTLISQAIKNSFYLKDYDLYIGKYYIWTVGEWENLIEIIKTYTPPKITQELINETFLGLKEESIGGKITDRDIQKAKEVSIDSLLEFKNNLALCLWHNETHASMRFYPDTNRVWCFSCSSGGDSISLIMKLKEYSFNEAVLYLCQKKR